MIPRMATVTLIALVAAILYLVPLPVGSRYEGQLGDFRELVRLTFLAAVLWAVYLLATGHGLRL